MYIPATFLERINESLPGTTTFQIDSFSSPELIQTAREAIGKAENVILYIETKHQDVSPARVYPILKKVVSSHHVLGWIEEGKNGLQMFKAMIQCPVIEVADYSEAVDRIKFIYSQEETSTR